jgi:hypothetical protein
VATSQLLPVEAKENAHEKRKRKCGTQRNENKMRGQAKRTTRVEGVKRNVRWERSGIAYEDTCARIYRPSFRESKSRTLVFTH